MPNPSTLAAEDEATAPVAAAPPDDPEPEKDAEPAVVKVLVPPDVAFWAYQWLARTPFSTPEDKMIAAGLQQQFAQAAA